MQRKKSLKRTLSFILLLIIIGLFIVNSGFLYLNSKSSIKQTLKETSILHAERISAAIDPAMYKEFLENPVQNSTYNKLRLQLNDYREKTGALYVYTLLIDKNNGTHIMIDGYPTAEEAADIGEMTTSTSIEDLTPILDGGTSSTDIVVDPEYGEYMSAFAPIKDEKGTVIGIVGVDMEANLVHSITKKVLMETTPIFLGISMLLLCIIITVTYKLFGKKLSPLTQISKAASTIATGDLVKANSQLLKIKNQANDEIGLLHKAMSSMTSTLEEIVNQMQTLSVNVNNQSISLLNGATELNDGTIQIAKTMDEMASGAESQASLAMNLAENMREFSYSINQTNKNGKKLQEAHEETTQSASTGISLMNHTIESMDDIYKKISLSTSDVQKLDSHTKEVSKLVSFIRNIAEQTNLLALNAAIEAARAGEHGKGFAVVAAEVKKLAEQVSNSVDGIQSIVKKVESNTNDMVMHMKDGLDAVVAGQNRLSETSKAFNEISAIILNMNHLVTDMYNELQFITNKQQMMANSIDEIAAISEENAAGIEQVAASSQQMNRSTTEIKSLANSLSHMSTDLKTINERFKV
ncbi:methyl-accepting chemotaxis protein [Cytobacillus sp.]|uniref:methyl-accepting chemotaxis protein n=1 Tax=Cytobacillus sp. TaxID=2675269 RepID=UPI0028BE5DE2|nr:methyl-accepting chemotaxis protein [Cytobacillus sp.]